ncbi:MAG: UDP-2,3-diacylglucosamine diphosphatase LpxI [Parvibaculum sp.]|uniref:LpxI family protein n=1 Tax=Parvibaculum sp. TaxID=2024848 RepID=UPI00271A8C13|nr:UDP-2,3-diacylglucosamine diphosphatase LpxI [Parvibaculum sp.]MDO8840532.1 UDP-2,3-diacylglucosamine diphosphatase LpxI [Parvibaculum sp.]
MTDEPRKLGIVAGRGPLPVALAESAIAAGREVFIVAIDDDVNPEIERFPHARVRIGAHGEFLRLLKKNGCRDIVLIGGINRPDLSKIGLDFAGIRLLPRLVRWLAQGDDGLLRGIAGYLEKDHGLRVIGAHEVAENLLVPEAVLTTASPEERHALDIDTAIRAALDVGARDIGQGAVACRGVVLAREDDSGTDAMLARVAAMDPAMRGRPGAREGVLVKLTKPGQERRVDMPTIGVKTVENAAAAGLAGIAVEAGGTLMVDGEEVASCANAHGLFVVGLSAGRIAEARR